MAIGDDFAIDWPNKRVHHIANSNVWRVNQLYTWIKTQAMLPQNMNDDKIMTAETPIAYTMRSGFWLDIGAGSLAHQYLSEGAIQTDGYDGEIYELSCDSVTVDPQASDIGKMVNDDGVDAGILVGFLVDPDGTDTARMWIRDTESHGVIADNSAITIDGSSMSGTANGDSVTGEELFGNPYSLGTIASSPNAQLYIFQDGVNIPEWESLSNWNRGHIDVLIQAKRAGAEIDKRYITVSARQAGDLFYQYRVQLTTSGQNAVPLSTEPDINNITGDYYLLYDAETGGPFTVGELIQDDSGDWEAEVVSDTAWGTEGVLVVRGYREIVAALADNDSFTGNTSGAQASCNGTLGDTYGTWDAESTTPNATDVGKSIEGGTSGAKRILRGFQDDGTAGKFVAQVDSTKTGSAKDDQYKTYDDDENITVPTGDMDVTSSSDSTTVVSGFSDITIAHINGHAAHGAISGGPFSFGERVTYSGGEAIYIYSDGSDMTLANVTEPDLNTKTLTGDKSGASCTINENLQVRHTEDFNFQQQSAYPYSWVAECGALYAAGRAIQDVYEYFKFYVQENAAFSIYKMRDVLRKLWVYDYTGGSPVWTDETADARDDSDATTFQPLADADEVEDASYYGADEEFGGLYFKITTQGSHDLTVQWEYYNGSWINLATAHNLDDGTNSFEAAAGWHYVRFDWPSDWTKTAVNGETKYWVRARITAFTSVTTVPVCSEALCFNYKTPEVGEEYITAFRGYAEKPASPLGTYAGGTVYAARGGWLQGMAGADSTNIQLIDADGVVREPYDSILLKMTDVVAGTHVIIARSSAGAPERYFTSGAGNTLGDNDFVVTEAIPVDTPTTGAITIYDEATGHDHRFRYTGWTAGTKTFAFVTAITGSTTSDGGRYTINDSGATFLSENIEIGDLVRNTTDGSWAHVVEVVSDNEITTTPLTGGTNDDWGNGDGYSFHTLPKTYSSGTDTAYVPYIDEEATGTSVEETVLSSGSDRSILARARKAGRQDFDATGTLDKDIGYQVAANIPVDPQYGL